MQMTNAKHLESSSSTRRNNPAITANLQVGDVYEKSITVTREMTVAHYYSHLPEVYATPMMILLMEATAAEGAERLLPEGWITVGAHVNVKHLAPTPVGCTVTARAELLAVEGSALLFAVEAHDGVEKIGEGTHMRAIVQMENFEAQVQAKGLRCEQRQPDSSVRRRGPRRSCRD